MTWNNIPTGRDCDLRGSVQTIREIWRPVKEADPNAVIITSEADNIGVIGTNTSTGALIGRLSGDFSISVTKNR